MLFKIKRKWEIKVVNYLIVGGIFMWPILMALVCGMAVLLEKTWYFLKNEKDMTDKFKKNLIKLIQNGNKKEIIHSAAAGRRL